MTTITRLNEIITQMKSLWPYGDKDFDAQINDNHNLQYPYMIINPPNSEMPEIYGGWEAYDFEIDFFDTYKTSNQKTVSIEKEWDNLQDYALEWFDNLMIAYNNPGGPNVQVYFLEQSLDFERVEEVANDRVIQFKMFFTLRAVTRCMLGNVPMNYYPNQIANLSIWLSADANITESIPTNLVSAWGDRSGNNNNVSQATKKYQPKRYTFSEKNANPNVGNFNQKARLVFRKNAQEYLKSTTPNNNPLASGDFTIFILASYSTNLTTAQEGVFRLVNTVTNAEIKLGQKQNIDYEGFVKDASGNTITALNNSVLTNEGIVCYRLSGNSLSLYVNNQVGTAVTTAGFDGTDDWKFSDWTIGNYVSSNDLDGSLAEFIVYDRALSSKEITRVNNYLNNKYKIY
jgi:hypothetical protein